MSRVFRKFVRGGGPVPDPGCSRVLAPFLTFGRFFLVRRSARSRTPRRGAARSAGLPLEGVGRHPYSSARLLSDLATSGYSGTAFTSALVRHRLSEPLGRGRSTRSSPPSSTTWRGRTSLKGAMSKPSRFSSGREKRHRFFRADRAEPIAYVVGCLARSSHA